MKPDFLSYFTPSLMSAETLENIFVQREELAQELVDVVAESASTPSKHYSLLVGPRGIGKTHLVSLIYHRVLRHGDLRERLRVAWLREEEWGVSSFFDLLLRVLTALYTEYGDATLAQEINNLYDLSPSETEHAAATLLKNYIKDRSLLLLMENLDDLFEGMGDAGQKRLRSYIQENPFWIIVATAQSLFKGISRRTSPFYGFFTLHALEDLSLDDATTLLTKIANLEDKHELSSFIQMPMGRARIRAVHHLAGGNPRVYVIFSQFLTRDALDDLVDPFMHMLDELTPYYQAKMKWLSNQQRKIVDFLCDHRGAVPVKEIAKRCFITPQTTSGQLQELRAKGYVIAEAVGREAYYELREPLMRMCIDVKKSRGGPIKLFVDFLRLWYTQDELKQCLAALKPDASIEKEHMMQALKLAEEESEDPKVVACQKDFERYMQSGDSATARQVAEELVAVRGNWADLSNLCVALALTECMEEAFAANQQALQAASGDAVGQAACWANQAELLVSTERPDEALSAYAKAIGLSPDSWMFWARQAELQSGLRQHKHALVSYNRAIKLAGNHPGLLAGKANTLRRLGRHKQALGAYKKAIQTDAGYEPAWYGYGISQSVLGHHDEALAAFNKAIEIKPDNPSTAFSMGQTLVSSRRYDEAIPLFTRAIEQGETTPCAFFESTEAFFGLRRWDEGIAMIKLALTQLTKSVESEERQHLAHISYHTADIIKILLDDAESGRWDELVGELVKVYAYYKSEIVLAQGLMLNVPVVVTGSLNQEDRHMWLKAWSKSADEYAEFDLPLRLLDAAVSYAVTQDQKILLGLPTEERGMLRQMLGLKENKRFQVTSTKSY